MSAAPVRPISPWELCQTEDGQHMWVIVPEHSASNRFSAMRIVEGETGETWKLLRVRKCWCRDHAYEQCGYKDLHALTDEQLERFENFVWINEDGSYNQLPDEFGMSDEGCWCSEWDGHGISQCKREEPGAQPAYAMEWRS